MPVSYPGFKVVTALYSTPEVQRNCLKALKAAGKKIIMLTVPVLPLGLCLKRKL